MSPRPAGEEAAFVAGFRACFYAITLTGADALDDAVDEAKDTEPDLPWPEED